MENKASRISFLVLLLLLMVAFAVIIQPFLVSDLVALIITVICWPINGFCMKLCRPAECRAGLATVLVSICVWAPEHHYYCCGLQCR